MTNFTIPYKQKIPPKNQMGEVSIKNQMTKSVAANSIMDGFKDKSRGKSK